MAKNYDPSTVGVPYVRASRIIIVWPDRNGIPSVEIEQACAVKLLDQTVRKIEEIKAINASVDLATHGNDQIPMIDPETGAQTGEHTTMNQVMLQILAAVRYIQIAQAE